MSDNWRPVVNAVLYICQFASELNDAEARRVANLLVTKPLGDLTIDQEYQALQSSLDSGEKLDTTVGVKFSTGEVRGFLARVIAELDSLRPWIAPALQEVSISRWQEFADKEPIARIAVGWPAIEGRVDKTFQRVDSGQGVLLRMRSGAEVALRWPGNSGKSSTDVISLDPSCSTVPLVQELADATALEIDDITIA
ncbi:hypothetical protein OG225_42040 (plasmid) [Nocardia sp. NBC_01377]|uniref:hypothetical protein n=1 Tax=Nocardia sp. NBC_01377 TaxID=2903595 RepID=UPI002F907299